MYQGLPLHKSIDNQHVSIYADTDSCVWVTP
jgi:hypothetical protein